MSLSRQQLCPLTFTTKGISNPAAIYISTSITLVVYVGIILYHALRQLLLTRFGSKMKVKLLNALPLLRCLTTEINGEFSIADMRQQDESFSGSCELTSTAVQSSQGVQKSCNSRELKEPLLEDADNSVNQ